MWAIQWDSGKISRCFYLTAGNRAECMRFLVVYSSSFRAKLVKICRVELSSEPSGILELLHWTRKKNQLSSFAFGRLLHDLMSLPVAVIKYPVQINLKGESATWLTIPDYSPSFQGSQGIKNLKHLVSLHLCQEQRGDECVYPCVHLFLYSYTVWGPAPEMLLPTLEGLSTSINVIKMM